MSRNIIVLCEDQQHSVFVRRFLKKKGMKAKNFDIAPSGKGAGEQYVREQYPRHLETARKNNYMLIVMIDGDNDSTDARMRELQKSCGKQNIAGREAKDTVAIFVPERKIEDWISYLGVSTLHKPNDCAPAVNKLAKLCGSGGALPSDFPPSLQHACAEWQRVAKL